MSSVRGTRASAISRGVVGSIPAPWDKRLALIGVVEDGNYQL